jgi:hypothetical protein
MKKLFPYYLLLVIGLLTGCDPDSDKEVVRTFHGNIIEFALSEHQVGTAQIVNTYSEKKVIVQVSYDIDLASVVPTIRLSSGATVVPASGEEVSFDNETHSLEYKVTSETGTTYTWVVQLEVETDPNAIRLSLIPNEGGWESEFTVYHDLTYNDFLTRFSGWNGGDGCVSLLLPDGSNLWSFQDSFFGDITPDRIRTNNTFTRNAGFIQKNQDLDSYVQLNPGTGNQTDTWIRHPDANDNDDNHWYWGGPSQVIGNEVQMLIGHIVPGGFAGVHQSTDVAVFTLPDMTLKEIMRDKYVGELAWDASLFKASDGYTYMYASENAGICGSKTYVARVANNDLANAWEYYTTDGWVTTAPEDHSKYVWVAQDNVTQPNVFEEDGKFYLVSQASCFGLDINIYESDQPTGPFTNQRTLYRIPDKYTSDSPEPPGYITYNAVVHRQLSKEGELVLSYNINPIGFENNFNTPGSADNYRPYFVRVYNWK